MRYISRYFIIFAFMQPFLWGEYLHDNGLYDLSRFSSKDQTKVQKDYFGKIEEIGSELKEKSGISLYLLTTMQLKDGMSIDEYGYNFIKDKPNSVVLVFSLLDTQVDIQAYPDSLYKLFDKESILSVSQMGGGSIIPLLPTKKKYLKEAKYTIPALLNGYGDIASEIAKSKGIILKSWDGTTNRPIIRIVELVILLIVLYAVFNYYRARQRRVKKEA